jgi:hypothetical protein
MTQTTRSKISRPSSTEAVAFTDGMLVTADDLQAAMHYPLSVVQVLLRSYFGCGIVCGLELTGPKQREDVADKPGCEPERGYVVKIAPGVALGCDGYPIELCSEAKLDLSSDPCGCPIEAAETRFIAIRRERASEPSSRGGCGCGGGCGSGGGQQQCTRQRDHILIQAFATPPKGACMQPPMLHPADEPESLCECLRHCSDCDCCADPWVVIGVLQIDADGVIAESVNDAQLVGTEGGRRYVKPIACQCASEQGWSGRQDMLEDHYRKVEDGMIGYEKRLVELERRLNEVAGPRTKDAAAADTKKSEIKA